MKFIPRIALVVALAVVLLLSMGGVALATPPEYTVWENNEWHEYCTQTSLDDEQDDYGDITSWYFVLVQFVGTKPTTIHVVWDNGASADCSIGQDNRYVAHYPASSETGLHVDYAYAVVYEGFPGNLVLSHVDRPCPPIPELPPVVLLGIGILGLVIYIGWKKRKAVFETRRNS